MPARFYKPEFGDVLWTCATAGSEAAGRNSADGRSSCRFGRQYTRSREVRAALADAPTSLELLRTEVERVAAEILAETVNEVTKGVRSLNVSRMYPDTSSKSNEGKVALNWHFDDYGPPANRGSARMVPRPASRPLRHQRGDGRPQPMGKKNRSFSNEIDVFGWLAACEVYVKCGEDFLDQEGGGADAFYEDHRRQGPLRPVQARPRRRGGRGTPAGPGPPRWISRPRGARRDEDDAARPGSAGRLAGAGSCAAGTCTCRRRVAAATADAPKLSSPRSSDLRGTSLRGAQEKCQELCASGVPAVVCRATAMPVAIAEDPGFPRPPGAFATARCPLL